MKKFKILFLLQLLSIQSLDQLLEEELNQLSSPNKIKIIEEGPIREQASAIVKETVKEEMSSLENESESDSERDSDSEIETAKIKNAPPALPASPLPIEKKARSSRLRP